MKNEKNILNLKICFFLFIFDIIVGIKP